MKRLLALLLSVLLILSLFACGKVSDGDGNDSEDETEEKSDKTGNLTAKIKLENGNSVSLRWEPKGDGSGRLIKTESVTATREDLKEDVNFDGGPLTADEIFTYEVKVLKEENGYQLVSGKVVSYFGRISGEDATRYVEHFREMTKDYEDDSSASLMLRCLETGEPITEKEELKTVASYYDEVLDAEIRAQGGDLDVRCFVERPESSTEVGQADDARRITHVENGAVSKIESHSGEGYTVTYFRKDLTKEKTEHYFKNELSETLHYDEKGENVIKQETNTERTEEVESDSFSPEYDAPIKENVATRHPEEDTEAIHPEEGVEGIHPEEGVITYPQEGSDGLPSESTTGGADSPADVPHDVPLESPESRFEMAY